MKTIIKGKFYDTDTAITIGKFGEEELFKRRYIHLIILLN